MWSRSTEVRRSKNRRLASRSSRYARTSATTARARGSRAMSATGGESNDTERKRGGSAWLTPRARACASHRPWHSHGRATSCSSSTIQPEPSHAPTGHGARNRSTRALIAPPLRAAGSLVRGLDQRRALARLLLDRPIGAGEGDEGGVVLLEG